MSKYLLNNKVLFNFFLKNILKNKKNKNYYFIFFIDGKKE